MGCALQGFRVSPPCPRPAGPSSKLCCADSRQPKSAWVRHRKTVAAGLRAQVEAERRAAAAEKPSMPTYGTAVRRAPSCCCWPLSPSCKAWVRCLSGAVAGACVGS